MIGMVVVQNFSQLIERANQTTTRIDVVEDAALFFLIISTDPDLQIGAGITNGLFPESCAAAIVAKSCNRTGASDNSQPIFGIIVQALVVPDNHIAVRVVGVIL